MDPNPNVPVAKQRSPWVYVALGCGGFALLLCLGIGTCVGAGAYQARKAVEGLGDPSKATENALKRVGQLPDGYFVYAGMNMFVMEMFIMGDQPPMADGGVGNPDHLFTFFHIIGNDQNKQTKAFFTSDSNDTAGVRNAGINIDAKDIIKRGQLTIDTRKLAYVSYRGRLDTGAKGGSREGLNTAILFDCPGDDLNIGVWNQGDPDPSTPVDQLNLTGTVADEAQLSKFVKPLNPCQ